MLKFLKRAIEHQYYHKILDLAKEVLNDKGAEIGVRNDVYVDDDCRCDCDRIRTAGYWSGFMLVGKEIQVWAYRTASTTATLKPMLRVRSRLPLLFVQWVRKDKAWQNRTVTRLMQAKTKVTTKMGDYKAICKYS